MEIRIIRLHRLYVTWYLLKPSLLFLLDLDMNGKLTFVVKFLCKFLGQIFKGRSTVVCIKKSLLPSLGLQVRS